MPWSFIWRFSEHSERGQSNFLNAPVGLHLECLRAQGDDITTQAQRPNENPQIHKY
jgi:hypothetical protein